MIYFYWMLLLNGIPTLIASFFFKNMGLRKIKKEIILPGIAFGFLAPLAYGLAVWCMQFLPIAYVSSIREMSIIFATINIQVITLIIIILVLNIKLTLACSRDKIGI